MDAAHRRAIQAGVRRQAKASAERRRCPSCGRGGGLGSIIWLDKAHGYRVCRYCGHEQMVG